MAKPKKDPATPTSDLLAKVSPATLGLNMGKGKHAVYRSLPKSQHIKVRGR